jgi:hypothetical protein
MSTNFRLGRLAGVGALAALVFTAACEVADSTAPTDLSPPEVALNRTDPFVEAGAIWVCQETPSSDDVARYSFVVGGDADVPYGFPVEGTESGEFEISGSVFDDGNWSGNPAESDACARIPSDPMATVASGAFQVTLETPATFTHELFDPSDVRWNPNRWALGSGRFGNFLFETSHRDGVFDCDQDGVRGDISEDGLRTLEGECPLLITEQTPGAIIWFKFTPDDEPPPPTGMEGCTPGGWRNNYDGSRSPNDWWLNNELDPDDLFTEVWDVTAEQLDELGLNGDLTLLEALNIDSGRGGLNFLKHATAALLNSLDPDVLYPYTESDVRSMFETGFMALLDGERANDIKDMFDEANNLGCPQ